MNRIGQMLLKSFTWSCCGSVSSATSVAGWDGVQRASALHIREAHSAEIGWTCICRSVYNRHQIKHITIAICVYRKICLVEFMSPWTARFCIDQHYNIIFQHRSRDRNAGIVKVDRDTPLDMMFSAATREYVLPDSLPLNFRPSSTATTARKQTHMNVRQRFLQGSTAALTSAAWSFFAASF
jgi:hypothetical protein